MDYNKITNIDESRLEKEWVGQADRYMEVVQAEALADKTADELKEKLEVTEATIDSEVRAKDPGAKEKAVAAAIVLDKRVATVKQELRDAKYDAKILKGALTGMEHRKAALENLVKMKLRFSGSDPTVQGAPKKEVEAAMAATRREAHPTRVPVKKGKAVEKTDW